MIKADTPAQLKNVLRRLVTRGVRGILISGGFDRYGSLPVEKFLPIIAEVKREYGESLFVSVHAGLARSEEFVEVLKTARINLIDFEFSTDPSFIHGLRGLHGFSTDVYVRSLERYLNAGFRVVPHILLFYPGYTADKLARDLRTLEDHGVEEVTVLVFTPTPGTPYEDYSVDPGAVVNTLRWMRERWGGRIYLGCMRPYALKKVLDSEVVKLGLVDRIANPYPGLLNSMYKLSVYDACCSVPEARLPMFEL